MHKLHGLECLRGFAAIYVLVGHLLLSCLQVQHPAVRFVLQFGQEAVMIFFLLSGFVIFWSLRAETTFHQYFLQRVRRIYPIYLAALAVAYASACWRNHGFVAVEGSTLLGNLLMMQDLSFLKPGVWFDVYYNNLPLWSLAYEWWFYMLFYPIERFVPMRFRVPLVFALSLIGLIWYSVLPMQPALYLMYFQIWWLGVEIARAYRASEEGRPSSLKESSAWLLSRAIALPLVMLATEALMLAVRAWFQHRQLGVELRLGMDPVLPLRHFTSVCAMVVIGLAWYRFRFWGFSAMFAPFIYAAPISYALYVVHFPILSAEIFSDIPSPILQAIAYIIVFLAIAWLLEIRLQNLVNRITKPWIKGSDKPIPRPT